VVAVVRYNGGGGSRFGRESVGAVGSDEGAVLRPFQEQKGASGGGTRART
jgi:hypothetical protein